MYLHFFTKICLDFGSAVQKSHIHNIMEKLALHTRLEIANYTYTDEGLDQITKSISLVNN